jgi:hypothetical protein
LLSLLREAAPAFSIPEQAEAALDITGPRRIDSTRPTRTGRSSSASGKGFAPEETGDVKASGLTGTGPLTAVDTILALQGVEDGMDQKSQGARHGEQLLGLLDEVRFGLLAGGIPRATLHRLAHAVASRREAFADGKLQGILDEIELRAHVELAKLEQSDLALSHIA